MSLSRKMPLFLSHLDVQFIDGHAVKDLADRFAYVIDRRKYEMRIIGHGEYQLICR